MVAVAQKARRPGARLFRPPGTAAMLVLVTVGMGLNLRAWFLLGTHLHERFDVRPEIYTLLVGLPLLVAALIRLPIGVLTDRYGAGVTFPVISLAAAGSTFGLGLADSLPAVVVAGSAVGIAGGSLVVGGAVVSRTVPYGRRGLGLGIIGLGMVLAVAITAVSSRLDPGGRISAMLLGAALLVFAGLAALVLRDPVPTRRSGSPVRDCLETFRLSSVTSLSLLHALALGGVVAVAVYLPVYLVTAFHLEWPDALTVTGTVVVLASVARLAGGFWTDRRPTTQLLLVCYATAAILCLFAAGNPGWWWLSAGLIGAIAVCDGIAGGALLALIGKSARAGNMGAVLGVTGATAAFGGLLSLLLFAGIEALTQAYTVGWSLLAMAMLGAAFYVRNHGLRIGLGPATRFVPEPSPTGMTVAVVGSGETRLGAPAVVARLAELAVSDELVVVYGSDRSVGTRPGANVLVTGLRLRLPRYRIVGVGVGPHRTGVGPRLGQVGPHCGRPRPLADLVNELIDTGEVAVAVTSPADLRQVAAELCSRLRADRVLRVSFSPADGAGLHEVWNRGAGRSGGS